MKTIIPTNSNCIKILVDDEDYELLNSSRWHLIYPNGKTYAARDIGKSKLLMHREIMNLIDPIIKVDHKDGNGINNQRHNLRKTSHKNNLRNINKKDFKGATFRKGSIGWRSRIMVDYKEIHLGYFKTREEAARSYDRAALKYFGEFANTNFKDAWLWEPIC